MKSQDIDYLNTAKLVDYELQLTFIEKDMTSAPDSDIPVYKFRMIHVATSEWMGEINLRAGFTENIEQYRGNIGFTVFESYRGHYFSARSCLLLKPFINFLGMSKIWLTCNIDNIASKKNIKRIGATYVGTTRVGEDSFYAEFYPSSARVKFRYEWDLQ